jgi:hypothetical protein
MKKYVKTIAMAAAFAAVGLLALGPLSFSPEGKINWKNAEAKSTKKTKWHKLLENNQVPGFLWAKYLPRISRREYNKTKKKHLLYLKENQSSQVAQSSSGQYQLHQNITTTTFWVGEPASSENGYISNTQSAWDEKWMDHFGGFDDPDNRNGYYPASFTPKENPFYFALPYNDLNDGGSRKSSASQIIPWASEKSWSSDESMCKNRWIKIMKGSATAYAQWEDVGPFLEDDSSYVFGTASPSSSENDHAGLDVSPAVKFYLGLSGMDSCSWQFVDAQDVPDGPWKQVITTSNIYWE